MYKFVILSNLFGGRNLDERVAPPLLSICRGVDSTDHDSPVEATQENNFHANTEIDM